MSDRPEDQKHPKMLPSLVVGLLREKCRQQAAAIAALKAKNQGQAVEIEELRAALERRPAQSVEIHRDA
ncbi:MAG: hypothetical protein GEV13_28480 [Rhodospirillales bacterium]|nr:hypothetical protein [Rhodospirillales bacterium]